MDTDRMGVVHNSNYFRFFERARCEAMRRIGIAYRDIEASGVMMPVVEQYAKYFSSACYDDELIVRVSVEKMPCAKMRFDYKVLKNENGKEKTLCQGYNVLAFIDQTTSRPKACPEWITKKLHEIL